MNQKNNIAKRPVADLVSQFLALALTDPEVDRRGAAESTILKIDERGITYTFTQREVETLKLLHELTGAPLEWLANDAIGWARRYMSDLTRRGTGDLFDLIDIADGGACPVKKENRARTREFIAAVDREWKRQWAAAKMAA